MGYNSYRNFIKMIKIMGDDIYGRKNYLFWLCSDNSF